MSIHPFRKLPGMGSSSQDLKDVAEIITMRSLDVMLENELSSQLEFMGLSKIQKGLSALG